MQIEQLEARDTPAVVFTGSVVRLDPGPSAGSVTAWVDGRVSVVDVPDGIVKVYGTSGNDYLTNNTSFTFVANGRAGNDTIFGGTGVNVIGGGVGRDVVYALLGDNTINVFGKGRDRVFTNDPATVVSGELDRVARFFGGGRVPGSDRVEAQDGVLYITPANGGSSTLVSGTGDAVTVRYNGQTFAFSGVHTIAYFGGSGDDTYVNATSISEAAYGSAGNDTLVSGHGSYSLLKGSGGDDVLVLRASTTDTSGNGGSDVFLLGPGADTVRADALDMLYGDEHNDRRIIG